MKISLHGATSDKKHALHIMRNHNKADKKTRCFLLKEEIAICFSQEKTNGFIICTYPIN
jgi:hypothetical protein